MGVKIFCDLCGTDIPTESSMQDVSVGSDKLVGVCFNCASEIKGKLAQKAADVAAAMSRPAEAAQPSGAQQPAAPAPGQEVKQGAQQQAQQG